MDNIFGEVLGNSTPETTETNSTEGTNSDVSELGEGYNLDLGETEGDAQEAEEATEGTNDDSFNFGESNPTNQAFAQMRTQNKEFLNKLNELDAIAKAAGLRDVDDLIAKSKEAQIKKMAESSGISEDMAREIDEMRSFRAQYEQDKINQAQEAKERALVGTLQTFISDNNLSQDAVAKMSDNLEKDGFTVDKLMELPDAALNRIFSSYAGSSIQKNLEKKEAIKNELPLNQSSNRVEGNNLNKEIDKLAKMFAGKM